MRLLHMSEIMTAQFSSRKYVINDQKFYLLLLFHVNTLVTTWIMFIYQASYDFPKMN